MAQDVAIGSALRENLLSLKRTARVLDTTVLRLATGLKVNSALDNPSNYFTAKTLNDRANDLNRLLDNLNQSIRTLETANNGVTGLTSLVRQAESVAQQAVDLNNQRKFKPAVTGNADLGNGLLVNGSTILVGDRVRLAFRENGTYGASAVNNNVTITNTMTGRDLARAINNLNAGFTEDRVKATILNNGTLRIETVNDYMVRVLFDSVGVGTSADVSLANALGFSDYAREQFRGTGIAADVGFDISGNQTLRSHTFADSTTGGLATRSSIISQLQSTTGNPVVTGIDSAADLFLIGYNNKGLNSFSVAPNVTIQDFVNGVNNISSLQGKIYAEFDDETGQILISAISPEVQSIDIGFRGDSVENFNFGFTVSQLLSLGANTLGSASILIGEGYEPPLSEINELEDNFDKIRAQIDNLTLDANYRGIGLLNGQNLTTFFNEDFSSKLVTEGKNLSANGLGFEAKANFRSIDGANNNLDETKEALGALRSFSNSLANNLAILKAREIFTKDTINTHKTGSDDLTVADQNQEGANLLAIQTRQALGITALSLSAQSQQSVLRIF